MLLDENEKKELAEQLELLRSILMRRGERGEKFYEEVGAAANAYLILGFLKEVEATWTSERPDRNIGGET